MGACLAASQLLELVESQAELRFVGTHKLHHLLTSEEEVELRNGRYLERCRAVTVFVSLDSAEHDVLVFIAASSALEDRLESHTGRAAG